MVKTMASFQVKIVGDFCNLRCSYCRNRDFDQTSAAVMSRSTLVRLFDLFDTVPHQLIRATWHGGEPLLAGKAFFSNVVELQSTRADKTWLNSVQTNGILIDHEWAEFFSRHKFAIGVSIDGDRVAHDTCRLNLAERGSFDQAVRGVSILREHRINPGVICTVTKQTVQRGGGLLAALVDLGFKSIAFNAFYNTASGPMADEFGLTEQEWLGFLIDTFETWRRIDRTDVSVREVDEMVAWTQGRVANSCYFKGTCETWFVVDHDGAIYPCERLGRANYFGNVNQLRSFDEVWLSQAFLDWKDGISVKPTKCRICEMRDLCHNGCTAHRYPDSDGVAHYVYCESRLGFHKYLAERLPTKQQNVVPLKLWDRASA